MCDLTPWQELVVHGKCAHNELVAIRNRVQQELPEIRPDLLRKLKTVARCIQLRGHPDPEWWRSYRGRKLTAYQRAYESLAGLPVRRTDAYVNAFVKPEKLLKHGDPRMIQARSPRYNCALGAYLRPIEHELYVLRKLGRWLDSPLPVIAKGLNLAQRARIIEQKMQRFGQCYSLDLSRFDAHIAIPILRVEHSVYLRAYGNDPQLRRLLSWQEINKCFCNNWAYNSIGGRMSGDMNTALGNCLIMLLFSTVAAWECRMQPEEYDLFVDGDDTLVFTRSRKISQWPAIFRGMGQELKVEGYARELHRVEHCRCRPVRTVRGIRMTQSPYRVLARTLAGVRHWHDQKFWPAMLTTLGICELALSAGVPILQEFALAMLRTGRGIRPKRWVYLERYAKVQRELREFDPVPLPITAEARATMWEAWDISPAEQYAMEYKLRRLQSWDAA
nr:RNA-dependent RNA polymerase [Riboviria sp.]